MRRPAPLVLALGIAVLVILAGSITTIAVRAGDSGSSSASVSPASQPSPSPSAGVSSASPSDVTSAYYAALHEQDAAAAFALLCPAQQQQGEGMFAQTVAADQASGTGVAKFALAGAATVTGTSASVPGAVTLDDGDAVPIHVLLLQGATGWQVCSSDLGGVLPGPGSSPSAGASV